MAECYSRVKYETELKEFFENLKQEEIEERKKQLSWKPKLGESPLSDEAREKILQERECRFRMMPKETLMLTEPGRYHDKLYLSSELNLPPIRDFCDDIPYDDWVFRQISLDKFVQAARKIIIKARLENNLNKLKEHIKISKCPLKNAMNEEKVKRSDLIAPFCSEVPPYSFTIDVIKDIRERKFARLNPYHAIEKEDYHSKIKCESSAPLKTRSDYTKDSFIDTTFVSFQPLTFDRLPYDDEDLFILPSNGSSLEHEMEKNKESLKDEKNENVNPYSPTNLPTLESSLYKNNNQAKPICESSKKIFDDVSKKSFLSKSLRSNCIFKYIVNGPSVAILNENPHLEENC